MSVLVVQGCVARALTGRTHTRLRLASVKTPDGCNEIGSVARTCAAGMATFLMRDAPVQASEASRQGLRCTTCSASGPSGSKCYSPLQAPCHVMKRTRQQPDESMGTPSQKPGGVPSVPIFSRAYSAIYHSSGLSLNPYATRTVPYVPSGGPRRCATRSCTRFATSVAGSACNGSMPGAAASACPPKAPP